MENLKQSLRKKPTYDEVINYIENDKTKIKYPDRLATFLRNSPYLSIFDGDSFIDLEEQENNITKEKLKEEEVKKLASETQTTAQVERIKQRIKGIKRTTMQLKQNQANRRANKGIYVDMTKDAQTPTTEMFDMTVDDMTDTAMEEAEQEARRQEQQKKQNIINTVSRHLGQDVRDIPYLNTSTASSSQTIKHDLPAENTSNPRGRPPKKVKQMDDETEDTTQRRVRTRSPKRKEEVKTEKDKIKRSKSTSPSSPPKSKKQKNS